MSVDYSNTTINEATQIQHELKEKLKLDPLDQEIITIGGADISFNKFSPVVYAGIIILSFPDLKPIVKSLVKMDVSFPYVPGFLGFREVPALHKAWEKLPEKPDVLMIDGHGIAHPRKLGIAAHFGALTGQPTIGCAKKLLFGEYEEPALEKGSYSVLYNKEEPIGWVLRTKEKVKPVFISPGYGMSMEDSLIIALKCIGKYRLPEPTRLAHEEVNLFRIATLNSEHAEN